MILNASYLVADEHGETFATLVADLRARADGLDLELTGPWPAYSFVGDGGR